MTGTQLINEVESQGIDLGLRSTASKMMNALTIDLEDWTQSVLGSDMPITECVLKNTDRVLDFLKRHQLKATFFALGKVCEKFPALLPRVVEHGHEIGTHGFGHELVFNLTPQQFADDVGRSLDLIEKQTGHRPIGYRAPAFSITRRSLWAGPILADLGLRYSSSIFPIAGRRYGIPDAPRYPHDWSTCDLKEFPLTTLRLFGKNIPVAGGGYLRLFPARFTALAIRDANRKGQPATIYLHPYELAVGEIRQLQKAGWNIHFKTRWTQSLFRSRIAPRLDYLVERFGFAPMGEVLGLA